MALFLFSGSFTGHRQRPHPGALFLHISAETTRQKRKEHFYETVSRQLLRPVRRPAGHAELSRETVQGQPVGARGGQGSSRGTVGEDVAPVQRPLQL